MSNFFAAIHSGFNSITHSAEHLMIIIAIFCSSCGKKSTPVYKTENQKENIIIIS